VLGKHGLARCASSQVWQQSGAIGTGFKLGEVLEVWARRRRGWRLASAVRARSDWPVEVWARMVKVRTESCQRHRGPWAKLGENEE